MRTVAARKFGLSPKRVKEPFMWTDLVDFALLYGINSQGYCHLVVATMAILSFGAMCRYNDVSRLKWGNIKFESNLSSFEITFENRKNSQFHQGNRILVAATKDDIFSLKLLLKLKDMDPNGGYDSSPIFCGFNGRLVAKNPQKRYLFMYLLSIRIMLDICLSGSVKYLAFLHKNLRHNMVLNRLKAEALHRRLTLILISNFGVNMVIGLHSKAKNVI